MVEKRFALVFVVIHSFYSAWPKTKGLILCQFGLLEREQEINNASQVALPKRTWHPNAGWVAALPGECYDLGFHEPRNSQSAPCGDPLANV